MSNEYHFITQWRIFGTLQEVVDVLSDDASLSQWWPSVYLEVKQIAAGDERGLGRRVEIIGKGWLPYTIHWQFEATEIRDRGFTLAATGGFVGRGIWTFEPDGQWVNITYDWKIRTEEPLMRRFSPVLRPIFALNHNWAMAKGEESLHLELSRRRAKTAAERALIPAPPKPTTPSSVSLILITLAISFVFYRFFQGLRRTK